MPDYRSGHPQVYLRKLSPDVKKEIVKAAKLRGYNVTEYVTRLVKLHQRCRAFVDMGIGVTPEEFELELRLLGLETVREE
jgi:DNA-binding IclR family transcriptional regulator